jgi:hypothetical protein
LLRIDQVLVKVLPPSITVLSGMVTSPANAALSQAPLPPVLKPPAVGVLSSANVGSEAAVGGGASVGTSVWVGVLVGGFWASCVACAAIMVL